MAKFTDSMFTQVGGGAGRSPSAVSVKLTEAYNATAKGEVYVIVAAPFSETGDKGKTMMTKAIANNWAEKNKVSIVGVFTVNGDKAKCAVKLTQPKS